MQVGFDTTVTGKCAQQAQKWLRQSVSLFRAAPNMFPGDEDNGSMGAWFIFNALGLYPLSPASGNYTIGSPIFARVDIPIGNSGAATLVITATNQGPDNIYVAGVTWQGVPLTGVTISYAELMNGGTLAFTMSATPAS
jgi:putative alpha-1,2-mannosidase